MLARVKAFITDEPIAAAIAFTAAVTALRLIHLATIATELGPDEAQYWFWGQELAWGYYSKPPVIAWLIRLGTEVFGDTRFGVRVFSPLLLAGTGLALFLAGRRLFGDKAGLVSLLLWHLMPAVLYGGTLMATDIPLLFFVSMALFCLVGAIEARGRSKDGWALALGLSLGFAFLSKYAAIYFLAGAVLALLTSRYMRRGLTVRAALIALFVMGAAFVPNVLWNVENGFQTVRHTADNAGWRGLSLHPGELLSFAGDQFGVLGPLLFGVFLLGAWRFRFRADPKESFLLSFALPPLVIIGVQALLSRAHANWAMAAYPSVILLLPIWMMRLKVERFVLPASAALHGALWMLLVAVTTDFGRADALGLSSAVKRHRGWQETAEALRTELQRYDGLVLDDREIAAHLLWEFRESPVDVEVFDNNGRLDNTFEIALPYRPRAEGQRLLASTVTEEALAAYAPLSPQPAGTVFIDVHAEKRGRPERTLDLYEVGQE